MICLFAFPRSGSDWITACLNSVQGIDIATEPFYGLRGQPETEWLETRHPGFYEGDGAYRGDYMQPTPSERMRTRLPAVVEDWVRSGTHGHNGFKEVYMAHKLPLVIEGVQTAGIAPRVIYLWRHFAGLCTSYDTRGFYWWICQTFEQQRERSVGTAVAPIYHLFEPETKPQKLFLIWLAACYRDRCDIEDYGGFTVCYDDLIEGGPQSVALWNRLLGYVGYRGEPFAAVRSDHDTLARVADQTAAFTEAHRDELDWMYLQAAQMADAGAVARPHIILDLLEAAGQPTDVAAQAEGVE